jgi:hypothetical protein
MPVLASRGAASARGFGFQQGNNFGPLDSYFSNVSMLLDGNGTNGATNNTFLDDSTNNFTITRNGNTTQGSFSPYASNWSNYFDGSASNARVTFASDTAVPRTGNFTAECWINPTSISSGTIWGQASSASGDNGRFGLFITSGILGFSVAEGSGFTINSSTAVTAGKWYHVAVTKSGSNYVLYLNGTSVGTATNSFTLQNGTFRIGTLWDGDGSGYQPYTGYVSNLRIVQSVVYSGAFTPPTTNLTAIANTSLLTCQDNKFKDNSTNNFSVTIGGSPKVQSYSPFRSTRPYSTSVIGGSGYLATGGSDYLTVASNAAFCPGTGQFSVEYWYYKSAYGGNEGTMINTEATGGLIVTEAGGGVALSQRSTGNNLQSSTTLNANAWSHVVVCRNGSNVTSIFVNGTRVVTGTVTANFATGALYVGNLPVSGYWATGYYAGLRIVKGSTPYDPTQTTITVPTAPPTAITNTGFLANFTNAASADFAMQNDWETLGGTQVSTSTKKFGTGSLYMNSGSLRCYPFANGSGLNRFAGDFTFEYWFYPTNGSNNFQGGGLSYRDSGFSSGGFQTIYDGTTGTIKFVFDGGGTEITGNTITNNDWNYITLVRQSGTLSLYVNGTRKNTASHSTVITGGGSSTLGFFIGDTYDGNHYYVNGYMDDIRITNGYARYSGTSFTVPTAALPKY